MVYANRVEFKPNSETGKMEQVSIPVTDEWVRANKSNQWLLTTDKVNITSDGIDTAIITIQRVTALLTDGITREVVPGIGIVRLGVVDSEDYEFINLDINGAGTDTITGLVAGSFEIHCHPDDGESNPITIEVI